MTKSGMGSSGWLRCDEAGLWLKRAKTLRPSWIRDLSRRRYDEAGLGVGAGGGKTRLDSGPWRAVVLRGWIEVGARGGVR